MSILLKKVYKSIVKDYPIELIAGDKGLNNEVRWVHMVENKEISSFLEGQEVVFTTGIAVQTEDDLFELIKENIRNNASAMVINIGPYISNVTEKMIRYCNKKNFPLFTVPWKVKMARIMRVFYFYIIDVEKKRAEITNAIKNTIFSPEQTQLYIPIMNKYGFHLDSKYTVTVVGFYELLDETVFNNLNNELEFTLESLSDKAIVVKINNYFVILFSDISANRTKDIIKNIKLMIATSFNFNSYLLAVGNTVDHMTSIKYSYRQALNLINMQRKNLFSSNIEFYDDIGIYKVLFEIGKNNAVRDYISDIIQDLFDYDQLNGTDYIELLRLYLEYNGSINKLAKELFVHRNTINYRINKIENIINGNLSDFNTRMELAIALKLKNIYD